MKTPLEKSIEGFIVTPESVVVVIDGERFEREVLKGSIEDSDVQKLLPFQTKRVYGNNYVHIENESAYTIETNSHYIHEGDTLCARQGLTRYAQYSPENVVTCPGCLIKAKNIIVNHLYATEGIIK